MILGQIDSNLEGHLSLTIVQNNSIEIVEFLVDSGFNGYLAVPESLVQQLMLPLGAVQRGMTADGRIGFFDTVEIRLIWHDQPVSVLAQILDEPLVGTRLLAGNTLHADWRTGGELRLTETP